MGCDVREDGVVVDAEQRTSQAEVFAAGEVAGIGGADLALVEGELAGLVAAGAKVPGDLLARRARERRFAASLARAFALRPELKTLAAADTIVCRCEDVPLGRLDRTWSARQMKLYARVGMGPCQGRVCGAALAFLFGCGSDVPRPPLKPVAVAALGEEIA